MPASPKANGSAPAILCIGEDVQLLETRALLLRSIGAEVQCSTSDQILPSLPQALDQMSCDLLVLCHTVEQAIARKIGECAHRRVPPLQVLLLEPISGRRRDRTGVDFDAVAIVEPASLLRVAAQLLSG